MPLSDFAKDKIRSLHLSKHPKTTSYNTTSYGLGGSHPLDDIPAAPITPRTADPLVSSFPRSPSPSPEREREGTAQTKASSTAASSVKSNSSRKEPLYDETALHMSASPPLTSFLNDRHSASSAREEAWLKDAHRLRLARFALSILTLAISASALGVSGATLRAYHATTLSGNGSGTWQLRLWPVDIDLRPTIATLSCAGIIALANLMYIAVSIIPSPRSRTTLTTHLFTIATALTLILSLFATIFVQALVHQVNPDDRRDSIQSFTCRLYRSAETFNSDMADLNLPSLGTGIGWPSGFKRTCRESEAAGGLMAAVLVLSVVSLAVVSLGLWKRKGVQKARAERWEGKWSS
ncbi:uncharacterized protein HMPREF1541_01051 [Cyphellophora europaea CBS 101466]|uniref:Uncharacterized protein n=1 Tax=Cyphellophora europaea (strain CBS 101466) TaxID=1220924 RepID=W2SDV5_CYPE1|nr:uncharacterized protein HMPREF1541_01051 [Cyphellophora europaea CBS 101466]ETN46862.1 hypothetical protein HMPREF1541_01051 [Cyphellophora europaea CBS 101466]